LWTGIPVARIAKEESERCSRLEEVLHNRIIGQEEAIESCPGGSPRQGRPQGPEAAIGSFVFLGPTGVGKTELAKALAEFMFGSEDSHQLDMSEFMERHNVCGCGGASGYVGFDEAAAHEAVRRMSNAVFLLDEIEKAHQEVFNILLRSWRNGHLTDAKGRGWTSGTRSFIMTSNLGAAKIQTNSASVSASRARCRGGARPPPTTFEEKVQAGADSQLPPGFLFRIDATVCSQPTVEENHQDRGLLLKRVRDQLTAQGMSSSSRSREGARIKLGYDSANVGARPLRRTSRTC